jgi:hypothetical protein
MEQKTSKTFFTGIKGMNRIKTKRFDFDLIPCIPFIPVR